MTTTGAEDSQDVRELGRSRYLKERTHDIHERLDQRVSSSRAFEALEYYGRFVEMQYWFHRDIDALYTHPVLTHTIPDIAGRRRLGLIEQDLEDLGIDLPRADLRPAFDSTADLATGLGWLYVAEGSNLGAAFLLKRVERLGLSAEFGARHLAGHPDGRGLDWRRFKQALDDVVLRAEEDERVVKGATDAFTRVHRLADRLFD